MERTFDDLINLGDVDLILIKVKEDCKKKLRGKVVPGIEHDDIIQEAMIKAYRFMDVYDPKKAMASTFFDRMISNVIKSMYAKASTNKNLMVVNADTIYPMQDEEDSAIDIGTLDYGYFEVEFNMLVDSMNLNERERQIFELRCSGYEFVEISRIMGLTKARISQIWKGIKNKYDNM